MSANNPIQLRNPSSIYFGKISSRGDFVKSVSGTKVIALIDDWVAQGMEMLIADPGWKTYYDRAGSIDFLFIATHKKHTICGSLIPSGDSSSRRFPFIAATLFEIASCTTKISVNFSSKVSVQSNVPSATLMSRTLTRILSPQR